MLVIFRSELLYKVPFWHIWLRLLREELSQNVASAIPAREEKFRHPRRLNVAIIGNSQVRRLREQFTNTPRTFTFHTPLPARHGALTHRTKLVFFTKKSFCSAVNWTQIYFILNTDYWGTSCTVFVPSKKRPPSSTGLVDNVRQKRLQRRTEKGLNYDRTHHPEDLPSDDNSDSGNTPPIPCGQPPGVSSQDSLSSDTQTQPPLSQLCSSQALTESQNDTVSMQHMSDILKKTTQAVDQSSKAVADMANVMTAIQVMMVQSQQTNAQLLTMMQNVEARASTLAQSAAQNIPVTTPPATVTATPPATPVSTSATQNGGVSQSTAVPATGTVTVLATSTAVTAAGTGPANRPNAVNAVQLSSAEPRPSTSCGNYNMNTDFVDANQVIDLVAADQISGNATGSELSTLPSPRFVYWSVVG